MNAPLFEAAHGTAIFSACGLYRYRLTRQLGAQPRIACFVMLNPSTADAAKDDATVRRCIGFARDMGCGGLIVANLFALRATDPWELSIAADPVGPKNMDYLLGAACRAHESGGLVVCAWGVHGRLQDQDAKVTARLVELRISLQCLGTTAEGFARHPLYLAKDTALQPYHGRLLNRG